jgi:hypothetical protein
MIIATPASDFPTRDNDIIAKFPLFAVLNKNIIALI